MKTNMAAVTGHIKRKMFVQKVVGKESSRIATSSVKEFSQQSKSQIQRDLVTAEDRDGQKNFVRVRRSAAPAANVAMIAYSAAALKIRTTTYEHGINAKHHFGGNAGRTHAETMHASIKEVGMKLNKQTQWNENPFSIVTEIDSVGKASDRPAPNYDTKGSMGLGYKNDIANNGMNRKLGVSADGKIAISKDRQYILDSKGNEFIKIDPSKMMVDKHGVPIISHGQLYKPNGDLGDKFKVANPNKRVLELSAQFKSRKMLKTKPDIKTLETKIPKVKSSQFNQTKTFNAINPFRDTVIKQTKFNSTNKHLIEKYKNGKALSEIKHKDLLHKKNTQSYHAARKKPYHIKRHTPKIFDTEFKFHNPNENAKSFSNFKTDKVKCINLNHEAGKVAETAKIYKNSVNAYNKRVTMRNAKLFGQAVKNKFKTGEKVGNFMKNAPTMNLAKKNWRLNHYGKRAKRIEKNDIRLHRQLRRLPKSFIRIFTAPINQTEAGRALNIGTSMGRPVFKAAKVARKSGSWIVNQEMYKAGINIAAQIQARALNARRASKGLKPLSHKAQVKMVRQHLYKKHGQSLTGIFRKKAAKVILSKTTGNGLASEFIKGQMEATMKSNGSRKIAKKARRKARKDFMRKRTKNFAMKIYKKIVPKPAQNIVASIKAFFKKAFTNFLKLLNAMLKKLASTIVGKICIAIASAISGIMSFLSAILVPVIVPILIVIATMLMVASLIPNIAEGISNFISDRKANHTFSQEYDVLHDAHTAFIDKMYDLFFYH